MALPLGTHTNDYLFGRGKIYVDEFSSGTIKTGERFLGNCPGFTLTVESETQDHFSSTSGLRTKDDTATISVDFTGEITVDDITAENLALFIGGTSATVTQSATPITDELIGPVAAHREYQLGTTTGNPTGVRSVASVVVRVKEGDDASDAATSTAYAIGDFVVPVGGNLHYYMATVAGTSGGSAPTWPTAGETVADGTVTWQDMGLIIQVDGTQYTFDAASGRMYTMPSTALTTAIDFATVSSTTLSFNVDYTPAANTRTRISSGTAGSINGALRFLADNAKGSNRDLYIASANFAASGDMPFITDTEYAEFTIAVGVNTKDSSTATIIIDGQPV